MSPLLLPLNLLICGCVFVWPPQVAFVCLSLVVCVLCGLLEGHRAECASLLQGVDSKKVVLLSKVALWMVSYIHQCYVEHHNTAARRRGYLLFYRQTRAIALLPLLIQSLGKTRAHIILNVLYPTALMNMTHTDTSKQAHFWASFPRRKLFN